MISGLHIISDFLTNNEEKTYISLLDYMEWDCSLSRRVIHFGYLYNYHNLNTNQKVHDIPDWLFELFNKCSETIKIDDFDKSNLMIIVNEYLPGQGIAPHIDNPKLFGEWIFCIVLNHGCNMIFNKNNDTHCIYIKNKTLYCMTGDARYKYKHSIDKRIKDIIEETNEIVPRQRRISITFRYML